MATMFPCPNCGGQLKFDAESQKLLCGSCGSFTDIETYKPNDNIGFDSVNTNIYSCPNCGGEIQLIDNDGMEFCPFCGSQATMHEKFSTEGAPKYILPFQLNKKAARDKYKELTKKMHFIPGGLEKEENIEKLVGLYVPYYLYEYNAFDRVQFTGVSVYTSGEYTVTDRANIDVRLDVDNLKVPFDASQALDDSIASKLEPFAMNKVRDFHPAYLAGFFVENSTVDQDLYTEDSKDKAADYQTVDSIKGLNFAVEVGSAGAEQAQANGLTYTEVTNQANALMEVAAGTSDAAIIDSLMAAAMVGEGTSYSDLTYTIGLNNEEYGVGFRKGSDLVKELNDFFKESYDDGTMMDTAVKYGVQAALIGQ